MPCLQQRDHCKKLTFLDLSEITKMTRGLSEA